MRCCNPLLSRNVQYLHSLVPGHYNQKTLWSLQLFRKWFQEHHQIEPPVSYNIPYFWYQYDAVRGLFTLVFCFQNRPCIKWTLPLNFLPLMLLFHFFLLQKENLQKSVKYISQQLFWEKKPHFKETFAHFAFKVLFHSRIVF